MSEVVFITPNFDGFVRDEPVGTLLLATILKNAGIHADILQFHHFGDVSNFEEFIDCAIEKIFEKAPRIVSFYTRCDTYHISLRIAERIKAHSKDVYVVFGGPQADLSSEDTLREIPYVDYICCGEGETTIVPFFTSLINRKPDLTVCGLVYRLGDQFIKNPRPELIEDLDTLPTIDYSFLEFNNDGKTSKAKYLFPVDVGRGCPFSCTYCSTKSFWGQKYRLKSPERIVEEIREIHKKFNVTKFNFEHDMFTMNRQKVIRICEMIKGIGFSINWRCSARMDCLDKELVDTMVDAGMDILFVGIETGSPRMQKIIKKNLKLDDVVEKLRYISEKGVAVTASFIFGFPDETEEDFSQTMLLMSEIAKLSKINVQHHLCTLFPGTELTKKYGEKIVMSSVFSDITGEVAVHECEDIIKAHPVLFPHFYEFKTELREKIKYYPQFFKCWKFMPSVYEYILERYYKNKICYMLYDFTEKNLEVLQTEKNLLEIMKKDKFIDGFVGDERYNVLKEVSRFILWKERVETGSKDIFGVDVKSFMQGSTIMDLQETITLVTCIEIEDKYCDFSFCKI